MSSKGQFAFQNQLKIKLISCKKENMICITKSILQKPNSTTSSITTVDHTTFSCNIIECFGAKRLHFPVQNLMSFCDFSDTKSVW